MTSVVVYRKECSGKRGKQLKVKRLLIAGTPPRVYNVVEVKEE